MVLVVLIHIAIPRRPRAERARPLSSSAALRFRRDKNGVAPWALSRLQRKTPKNFLRSRDFSRAARCAFVATKALRATYGRVRRIQDGAAYGTIKCF